MTSARLTNSAARDRFRALRFNSRRSGGANTILPKVTPARVANATLEVIGGKYKVAVLFHLKDGARRFGELRRLVPTATQRMLTTQLRELERDALITRKVFAEVPPRVDYAPSAEGKSLLPILTAMCEWGKRRIKRGKTQQLGAQ